MDNQNSASREDKKALRKSEGWFRLLFDSSPTGAGITNLNGNIIDANRAMIEMTGYRLKELKGKNFKDICANAAECRRILEMLKKSGRVGDIEAKLKRKDGTIYYALTNVDRIEAEGKSLLLLSVRDVTENKKTEEALKQSEERYRQVVQFSPNGIFVVANETIVFANRRFAQMLGAETPENLYGKSVFNFIHPDYRPIIKKRSRSIVSAHKLAPTIELKYLRLDGSAIVVEATGVPFMYQGSGAILVVVQDITKRKEAEEAFKALEEFESSILSAIPHAVLMFKERTIIFANDAVKSVFGWKPEELTGKNARMLYRSDEEYEEIGRRFYPVLKKKRTHSEEFPCRRKDGKDVFCTVSSSRIGNRLKDKRIVAIYEDITEHKKAEEILKQSEEKYRNIFDNSVEGIFQTTPKGKYLSVNPALAKMIGHNSPEELMKAVTDLSKQGYVNPEDRVRYKKILEEQGTIQGFETQHYRKDGSIIWVSISARTVYDADGSILYYEGTIEDITAGKLAEEELKATMKKLRKSLVGTIQAMSLLVEKRDPYTAGHQIRVSNLARSIAQAYKLSRDTVDNIRMAGVVHDIGKMSVPAEILSKPTKLNEIEFSLIKIHAQAGYEILKTVDLPPSVAEMVLQHHERINGSGYPQSLKDGQIILEARILAVADVVEAIASHRPYRPAIGIDVALDEIEKNKGILYDADVVDICLKLFRESGFKFE